MVMPFKSLLLIFNGIKKSVVSMQPVVRSIDFLLEKTTAVVWWTCHSVPLLIIIDRQSLPLFSLALHNIDPHSVRGQRGPDVEICQCKESSALD